MASRRVYSLCFLVCMLFLAHLATGYKRSDDAEDIDEDYDYNDGQVDDVDEAGSPIDEYDEISVAKRDGNAVDEDESEDAKDQEPPPCVPQKPKKRRNRKQKKGKQVVQAAITATESESETEKPPQPKKMKKPKKPKKPKKSRFPPHVKARFSTQVLIDLLKKGEDVPEIEEKLFAPEDCPSWPWVWVEPGYCLNISHAGRLHSIAIENCAAIGGHLLTINSQQKSDAVVKFALDYMKYKMDDYWVSSIGRTKDSVLFWKATGEPLAFPYFNGRIIEKQPCLSFRQKELKLQEELSCAHRYMPSMCEKDWPN